MLNLYLYSLFFLVCLCYVVFFFFFFFSSRRRHTRLTCDWSLDVCSSDLVVLVVFGVVLPAVLCGPLSLLSPICSNTMPITTATPMSSAPSNAAYPAPRATSPPPPPRC